MKPTSYLQIPSIIFSPSTYLSQLTHITGYHPSSHSTQFLHLVRPSHPHSPRFGICSPYLAHLAHPALLAQFIFNIPTLPIRTFISNRLHSTHPRGHAIHRSSAHYIDHHPIPLPSTAPGLPTPAETPNPTNPTGNSPSRRTRTAAQPCPSCPHRAHCCPSFVRVLPTKAGR